MSAEIVTADGYVDAVMAVFPASRLTRRRTPDEHAALWRQLTWDDAARTHGEALARARLEQLGRRHMVVASVPKVARCPLDAEPWEPTS